MADKRISQLIERTDIANNDVLPIVASGASTTNKVTISTIQDWMQENLDVGVTSVGITLGTSGTDVNVTGSPITTSGNITINIPDASASARGVVNTGTQTFEGIKTFNNTIVSNYDIKLVQNGSALPTFIKNIGGTFLTSIGSNGIGFNGSNNIYFSGSNKFGGAIAFNNTDNRTYTLQDASGTLAFTSQLDGYVTLDTTQTITAHKTFTASGGQPSITINHSSGAGHALDITKAGNGEAIRVQKTSGSGNAITVIGANIEVLGNFVKTGGTSSQFLKADGSVDSSTYVTTDTSQAITATKQFTQGLSLASAGGTNQLTVVKNIGTIHEGSAGSNIFGFNNSNNIYFGKGLNNGGVITWNNAAVRYYTLPDADGTIALTSDLGNYVTIGTTQTITGSKTISNATTTFMNLNSTNANGASLNFQRNGVNMGHIGNSGVLGVGVIDDLEVRAGLTRALHLKTDGGQITLGNSGAVTLTGALNGTSASFTGDITTSGSGFQGRYSRIFEASAQRGGMYPYNIISGSGTDYSIGLFSESSLWFAAGGGITKHLNIASTGAATFSSSVTATGGTEIPNGQFYRARRTSGNLLTDMIGIPSGTNDVRILTTGAFSVISGSTASLLHITDSGNVGIGTPTPANYSKLQVKVGTDFNLAVGQDSGAVGIGAYNDALNANANLNITASNIIFSSGGERMRITSGGILMVGTSTVLGGGGSESTNGANIGPSGVIVNNSTSDFNAYFAKRSGFSFGGIIGFYAAGTQVGSISTNGSSVSYNTSSDYRLKENVKPVQNALSVLTKLKPCTFNYISNNEEEVMGFIAHEVQEVIPQAVTGEKDEVRIQQVEVSPAELDEEGNVITEAVIEEKEVPVYQGIDHSKLVPLLVAAIQEQQEQIKSLTEQVEALKSQING